MLLCLSRRDDDVIVLTLFQIDWRLDKEKPAPPVPEGPKPADIVHIDDDEPVVKKSREVSPRRDADRGRGKDNDAPLREWDRCETSESCTSPLHFTQELTKFSCFLCRDKLPQSQSPPTERQRRRDGTQRSRSRERRKRTRSDGRAESRDRRKREYH